MLVRLFLSLSRKNCREVFSCFGFTAERVPINVSLNEMTSLKSIGVTPGFINTIQEKGIKLNSLDKYIQLKSAMN